MRHYTWHNLSPAAQGVARILFRALACLCDAALSLLLGIAFVDYIVEAFDHPGVKIWNFAFIGTAAWALLVTRLLNIVPMSELANAAFRKKKDRITLRMQVTAVLCAFPPACAFPLTPLCALPAAVGDVVLRCARAARRAPFPSGRAAPLTPLCAFPQGCAARSPSRWQ